MSLATDLISNFTHKEKFPHWIWWDICWADSPSLNEDIILAAYEVIRNNEHNTDDLLE